MTTGEFLQAISIYPIPSSALQSLCLGRGLDADSELGVVDSTTLLTKADALMWLSQAPNVSQGGVTYSFSEYERKQFRAQAEQLYVENGGKKARFGYKGSRL